MKPISIGLADGHRLFREALMASLSQEAPRIRIAFEAENGRELLFKLDESFPELLLMEADLPELNGFEAVEFIRKKYSNMRILVLSSRSDHNAVLRMVDLGVKAYLHKNCSVSEVIKAIHQVSRHNYYFSEMMSTAMLQRMANSNEIESSEFSVREKEVAGLICQELTNQEIAERLSISPRTVEAHRRSLIKKTQSRNTAGLVVYLVRNGYV